MTKRKHNAVQVTDGSWYALGFKFTHEDCCDCQLSHRVDYKLESGRIFVRYRVDHRRTRANRKKAGIVVLHKERGHYER